MNLNELRDKAYKNACEHGFHEEDLGDDCYLILVICELTEAVEADRKNKRADSSTFISNIDLYRNWWGEKSLSIKEDVFFFREFNLRIKDSVEDELADTVIRLLDLAGLRGIDLSNLPDKTHIVTKEFTFFIFNVIYGLYKTPLESTIYDTIYAIFAYCNTIGVDLLWHIEMKMKYNECREYMHGKRY